jgi:hypothetical protein
MESKKYVQNTYGETLCGKMILKTQERDERII